ncbi:MAG TPA: carboxypeptidase regulatory-like domain-containing protein [Planctomycetota bacterium]|nr:carboxypeptidase regulatory-like domain-containing protein [Planctomycetota bacterium]
MRHAAGGHRRLRAVAPRRARPPIALFVLLACATAAAGWWGYRHWQTGRVTLCFEPAGSAMPVLELTVFPEQLAFAAPSPPPPLGQVRLDGGTSVVLTGDLVPREAVVRYAGPGVGTGFVFVRLGQVLPAIHLRPGRLLQGRVAEPIGFWCYGWRCAGLQPVAGAEVTVMGGGEHGIDLGSARTDAEGNFTIDGIDSELDGLGLRVRASGFAIAHQTLGRVDDDTWPIVALARTQPVMGRIVAPPGLDPSSLRVLARGLPGVDTRPERDGTFVLDHVPAGMEPRLLLYDLPPTWTYATVRGHAKTPVQIDIVAGAVVRGRVIDAETKAPLAGALVYYGDQDAVRADASGNFELQHVVPGDIEIQAQFQVDVTRRRSVQRYGSRRARLEPGQALEEFVVAVD